jgi:hypothetical protein
MIHPRLHQLVEDEKGKLSASRVGLWLTVLLALTTVAVDIALTVHAVKAQIPNTVYSLEGTMFIAFASWAGGPRVAQYLGPQLGQVATGIAAATRDARLPSKNDDERDVAE